MEVYIYGKLRICLIYFVYSWFVY